MSASLKDLPAILAIQAAADDAMQAVRSYLQSDPAPTSEAAHLLIDGVLAKHNATSPEGHIVASGITSAEPHARGSGAILPHTPIVIDIYPRSETTGYWADISRTVCLGTPPERLKEVYKAVEEAKKRAIALLAPGVHASAIQQATVDYFATAGFVTKGQGKEFAYAEGFVHSVGHGVGQQIHMRPHFSLRSNDILQAGDIVTIEPGLYYHDIGGIRLEDMLLITETGSINLTQTPEKLQLT